VKHNNPWHTAPAERTSWRDHAACRDADPDLFFPISTTGPALHQVDQAKRICQACPVRTPCLNWALDHGQVTGIWGGKTEEERIVIRRTRNAVPAMRQASEKYLTALP
jgi:WhiB family transcriptional regulator, redox-sensing transcriptional regulator